MKRVFISICICAVLGCVFADSTYSGSDSGSSVTMKLGLTADSGFTLDGTKYGHIVFGFTADGNVTETITPSESITLAESFDSTGKKAVAKGVVFAFVRVASLSKLDFSIEWSDLQNTKNASDKISYKVNGNGNENENDSSFYIFYSFDPSKDVMADERKELLIETVEYENSSKKGTYESTITMKVTVES